MEEVLVATGASLTITNVFAAGVFVLGVIDLLACDDDDVADALSKLQSQIYDLKIATERLRERLDDLVDFSVASGAPVIPPALVYLFLAIAGCRRQAI